MLDSYALLAYLNGEAGAEKVRQALEEAQESGAAMLLSQINVGEVYYILYRKRGREQADYFVETILPGLPLQVLPVDFSLVMEAARLKARYPLAYADCFALAAALRTEAALMTGDPEFNAVAELLTIEWLEAPSST